MRYWVIEDGDVLGEIKIETDGYSTDVEHPSVQFILDILTARYRGFRKHASPEAILIAHCNSGGNAYSDVKIIGYDGNISRKG
jgi:hypothetical protein